MPRDAKFVGRWLCLALDESLADEHMKTHYLTINTKATGRLAATQGQH